MIQVKYVHPARLLNKKQVDILTSKYIPVVELSALREVVEEIVGQAHGGAMLGGDDAYKACLAIEVKAQRLLASLGEQ